MQNIFSRVFLLSLFLLMDCLPMFSKGQSIVIKTQEEFDTIESIIEKSSISGFSSIKITILPGVYYFKDSHITLNNVAEDFSVSIMGNNVTLLPKSTDVKGPLDPLLAYYKGDNSFDSWGEVVQSSNLVEVVDADKHLCRLLNDADVEVRKGDVIQIAQWYYTRRYPITDVNGSYIYFLCDNLSYISSSKEWNVNYDYIYGKSFPRYRIYRTSSTDKSLTESKVINFLDLNDKRIKSLTIDGLRFEGCAYSNWKGLLRICRVNAKAVIISNCTFSNCKSICVNVNHSQNVSIHKCTFIGSYFDSVLFDNMCESVSVQDCLFRNCGTYWSNSFCIKAQGKDFHIARNEFQDFGYGAIGIGCYWETEKKGYVQGIVEFNEAYYTPSYFKDFWKHTLMDSGTIYTWTQNDNVVIRYNYIHDYTGMRDNRGIFCDDGTCNVKIYGNIVTNTPNSYSIDLRSVPSVESNPKYKFGKVNVGNEIYGNIVDNKIRFEGRKNDPNNGCKKGPDYIISDGLDIPKSTISSVEILGENRSLSCISLDSNVTIDKSSYKIFKKHPYFKKIKKWVKKGNG